MKPLPPRPTVLDRATTFIDYWREFGTGPAWALVRAKLARSKRTTANIAAKLSSSSSPSEDLLEQRFPALQPIAFYRDVSGKARLNLVTDSIGRSSLFGGVATALILATLVAEKYGMTLRVITRTEAPEPENYHKLLKQNFIPANVKVEFVFAAHVQDRPIGLRSTDRFITTSWWTTRCMMNSVSLERIIYLLQEDERMFYPYGDERQLCESTINHPALKTIVNTELLLKHLELDGSLVRGEAYAFEPAFDPRVFYVDPQPLVKKKQRLGFYARPNNSRNMFWMGLQAINAAINAGLFPAEKWELIFFGKDIPRVSFNNNINIIYEAGLEWQAYAAMVRGLDVGLSLMATPHPSYPPLDMAASGCVVVTNRFGLKQDLSSYSGNIISCDLDIGSLVDGLGLAQRRVEASPTKFDNLGPKFERSWPIAVRGAVEFCGRSWSDVCR